LPYAFTGAWLAPRLGFPYSDEPVGMMFHCYHHSRHAFLLS